MLNKTKIEEIIKSRCDRYGKNIYLLGTSSFGVTNEPTLVRDLADLYSLFGTKGTIIEAYKAIYNISSDVDIYCCKVSGAHAVAALNVNVAGDKVSEKSLMLISKCSNAIYNDIRVDIYKDAITFIFPEDLKTESISYKFNDCITVGELIERINADTDNGINHVYARCSVSNDVSLIGALDTVNVSSTYLYGATDGLDISKNNLYQALCETYDLLEGKDIDIIVPLGAYIDDIEIEESIYGDSNFNQCYYSNIADRLSGTVDGRIKSYYDILLKFCAQQLNNGIVSIGVIGFNPTSNINMDENMDSYVENIMIKGLNINKDNTLFKDYMHLVSVVGGDLFTNYSSNNFNGSCIYASVLAAIDAISTPTNKQIPDSVYLFNEFSADNINKLASNGITSFRYSPLKKCVVINSGVTSCTDDNDMKYIQNVRSIQLAITCLYDIVQEYIGEDLNELMSNNTLKTAIISGLDVLLEKEMIDKYIVDIVRKTNNDINIKINLKTQYMVELIEKSCVMHCEVLE